MISKMKMKILFNSMVTIILSAIPTFAQDLSQETKDQLKLIADTLPKISARLEALEQENQILKNAIPPGAIIAFYERCNSLPGKWSDYTDAYGRVIVGAVPTGGSKPEGMSHDVHDIRDYYSGVKLGEERVKIEIPNMPNHSHDHTDPDHTHTIPHVNNSNSGNTFGFAGARGSVEKVSTSSSDSNITVKGTGNGEPHNNMQPYIALYYCKNE